MIKRFLNDTRGATAIEYVLLATFCSVMIIAGISSIGSKLSTQYINTVGSQLK